MQAYVPTEAVAVSGTNSAGDQASSLIKIPYRIFVGGIAFNVSKGLFLSSSFLQMQ